MVDFLYGTLLDNLICQIHMIFVKLNEAKSLTYVHEMTEFPLQYAGEIKEL